MSIDYHLLQPVYCLCLVNDIFEPDMEEFYHYYRLVHVEDTNKVIDGLDIIRVERAFEYDRKNKYKSITRRFWKKKLRKVSRKAWLKGKHEV